MREEKSLPIIIMGCQIVYAIPNKYRSNYSVNYNYAYRVASICIDILSYISQADYDGDQVGAKGVWSVEANEECMKIINSKSYYLDLNCINIKVSSNEAIQSLYSLTKILDVDSNKLTEPVF